MAERSAASEEMRGASIRWLGAGRAAKTEATESEARLAALRQRAGLSQAQLAEAAGIPQRTLSFYEREAEAIPSTLVPAFAQALDVTVEEVLGIEPAGQKKRGPQSQLEKQMAAIASPPRKERFINAIFSLSSYKPPCCMIDKNQ